MMQSLTKQSPVKTQLITIKIYFSVSIEMFLPLFFYNCVVTVYRNNFDLVFNLTRMHMLPTQHLIN